MNSKVSVIIPSYNSEKTINKCLKSILRQSYKNYEVIIVNDGSTDNSKQLINDLVGNNDAFHIINQENSGSSEARKTGLRHMSDDSSYFCFCDSDDYLDEDFLLKMIFTADKYDADIVQCDFTRFIGKFKLNTHKLKCLEKANYYDNKKIMNELYVSYFGITNLPGNLCTKLYKSNFKNRILNLKTIVKIMGDDISVNIRILPYCKKLVTIPEELYYYRIGGNTTKFMPYFMNDCFEFYKLQQKKIDVYSLNEQYKYYSTIEIINEFNTWLKMCYRFLDYNGFNKEYQKWNLNKSFKEAVFYLKGKWDNEFYNLLITENDLNIYEYIKKEEKRYKIKQLIKKIAYKIGSILN